MMLWGNNRCILIDRGATFKCMLIAMCVVLQESRHLRYRQTPQYKLHHAESVNGLVPRSSPQQDKAKAPRFQQTRNLWLELLVATCLKLGYRVCVTSTALSSGHLLAKCQFHAGG